MNRWIFAILGGILLVVVALSIWRERELDIVSAAVATGSEAELTSGDRSSSTAGDPESTSEPDHQNDPGDEVVLDEAKQKRIWDNEHVTFELETYFGKAFQTGMRDGDARALAEFFTDKATIALIPHRDDVDEQAATVSQTSSDASLTESADIAGMANHLIQSLAGIKEIERSTLRVLHLETEDGLHWSARLYLKFVGRGPNQQPREVESRHTVGMKFSSDEEIKSGRILTSWRDDSRSARRSEAVLMKEVTERAGLKDLGLPDNWTLPATDRSQYWFQVAVADFNHDSFPDIAAATINGKPLLLQSDGGERFVDITATMRLKSWDAEHMQALATWIDIDNDSWPDLLLGNRLYRNASGKAFLDVTGKSGLQFGHFPMGTAVADYDGDGLTDLYILYQHDAVLPETDRMPWVGDSKTGAQNQLWRNQGGGRFGDVTESSNAGGGLRHSFAAVWHFLDEDRYPDLYIANDFGANVHLRNRGDGTFEDISREAKTADFATSMGVSTGDLDNDGRPELYVANMYSKMGRRIIGNVCDEDYPAGIYDQIRGSCTGNRLYTMTGQSEVFTEISESAGVNEVGWAYAPTMADFDSDGLLDIYATTGFMSATRGKPDG